MPRLPWRRDNLSLLLSRRSWRAWSNRHRWPKCRSHRISAFAQHRLDALSDELFGIFSLFLQVGQFVLFRRNQIIEIADVTLALIFDEGKQLPSSLFLCHLPRSKIRDNAVYLAAFLPLPLKGVIRLGIAPPH